MNLFLHWLRTLFRWFSVMILIPLFIIALMLTPLGLKITFVLLSEYVPGELQYSQVTGTLLGPLTIKQLSYRYKDQQIAVDRVYLQWHPSELLAGKIAIETLNIDGLVINTPKAPAPQPDYSLPNIKQTLQNIRPQLTSLRLPFTLEIASADIKSITWQQQPGEPTLQASAVRASTVTLAPDNLAIRIQGLVTKPYAIQTSLAIEGTPERYRFNLNVFNPQTHWVVDGKVDPEQVQLDTQKALVFGGELSAHLVWKWQAPMTWDLALTSKHLDFSSFYPEWPHPIDLTLNTSGSLGADRPHFSWNAVLKTPQSQITTQGQRDQQWDISWNIQINQLAELLPFSSGKIKSVGELHGSLNHPQTKGNLEAQLLRWQDYRVDKLNANWDVDISEARSSFIQIAAEQLFTQWAELQNLQLSAQGKWDNQQITAKLRGYNTDLAVTLAGGMKADSWQGDVHALTLTAPIVGTWKLSQPGALMISQQQVQIPALCLQSVAQSQACITGQWKSPDNAWKVGLTGRLNFQQIAAVAPSKLNINMPMDLHLSASGMGKTLATAEFTGTTPAGDIRFSGDNPFNLHINGIKISAKLDKNVFQTHLGLELAENNSITADFSFPEASKTTWFSQDQALSGKIIVAFNNLATLQALAPDTISPTGKLHGQFTVGGTLGKPLISGPAILQGGEIKIPGLNIQLSQINMTVDARGSELNYTMNATSGGQPLRLAGKTMLNEPQFPTDLTLTGESVLIADTPTYTVYVSPNIHIALKTGTIDITGTVDVPKGTLRQLTFVSETTLPEDEVVFIGEHPMAPTTPWNMHMQLTVNLGKDVKVDTPQVKGDLHGSLTLTSQPGQVVLATGRIDITNGSFSIYGRDLTIAPGSGIIYRQNPLSNPALSLQALTRILITDPVSLQQLGTNELTVGVNIGGTPTSPQITLFSSAGNLSQADILSFLLLGTSSAGISPTNMNLMLQALNTLPFTKKGAGGVQGLTNQVKQGLGLSELGVESEPTFGPMGEIVPTSAPTSYFVVGKRLTSRITFRYKYDPFNSVNLFQLIYLFSQNWSLQLETDGATQSGADILYTIQTGSSAAADKTTAPP